MDSKQTDEDLSIFITEAQLEELRKTIETLKDDEKSLDSFRKEWCEKRSNEIYDKMYKYEIEIRYLFRSKYRDCDDPIMQKLIPKADRDRAVLLARYDYMQARQKVFGK